MPRSSVAEAARTRTRIVDVALDQASSDGLEALTIGALAARVGMSKPGVVGPFGSREQLQLAVLDEGIRRFRRAVVQPVLSVRSGRARLLALADAWAEYLVDGPFPGGCFLTAVSCELDGRTGPLRDRTVEAVTAWEKFLESEVRAALRDDELPPGISPRDLAVLWNGVMMATNQQVQLLGRRAAGARARRLLRSTLAV